ncbi:MAG: hypothetical protein RL531_159 [Actinomycetota bacterium]|jgi:hypothetical protein
MAEQRRITPDDLRAKFEEINDTVAGEVDGQKRNAVATAVIIGTVVVVGIFLIGRWRGKRLATVVEIRRV